MSWLKPRPTVRHLRAESLLPAKAIDEAGVEAEVALQAAGWSSGAGLERSSRPSGRKAEGDVGVEVVVTADAQLNCRAAAILPQAEVDAGDGLGAAGKDAP